MPFDIAETESLIRVKKIANARLDFVHYKFFFFGIKIGGLVDPSVGVYPGDFSGRENCLEIIFEILLVLEDFSGNLVLDTVETRPEAFGKNFDVKSTLENVRPAIESKTARVAPCFSVIAHCFDFQVVAEI